MSEKYGERREKGGDGQTKSALPPLFNDSDFRKSTDNVILTNSTCESQAKSREQELDEFRAKLKEVSKKIKDDEKTKNLNKDIEI
ncbi:hypothetical protein [Campylobacter avium]|uniref:hypothetical protein n=1 Tax=Campylobacter avium TaxID=522485 RepID=UPI000B953255|nr:hypothetical protein [Campylobacter avium]